MTIHDLISVPGYTVHQLLGKGGMAAVYLATQESLHRKVAIKVLLYSDDQAFNDRFVSEARIIATLNHPRVITVYDVAQLPDGRHYITMEYLGGGDLTRFKGQVLPPDFAMDLIRQIAEGLSVVHRKGIIHRDIKPGNILFREDGSLVLTDFGIAKDMTNDSDLTQTGMTLGSPSYCSPEQTYCEPLDQRTDIYSLGVILLEMLLGHNPYKGANYTQTVRNHAEMPVPPLPPELQAYRPLLEKMLAKRPQDRFASADDLLAALRGEGFIPVSDQTLTFPTATRIRPGTTNRQRATIMAIVIAFFLIGMAGGGAWWWHVERQKTEKVQQLLSLARDRFVAGKLTSPDQDSAEYYFHQVLAVDPHNADAQRGLQEVETRHISELLQKAEQRLKDQKLSLPPMDNAVHYYQQVLILDPENAQAKDGLNRVVASYVALAQKAWARGDSQDLQQYADKGLALDPDNATLLDLKSRRMPRRVTTPIERFLNRILN